MRLLLDECVPRKVKFLFADGGHECETVRDELSRYLVRGPSSAFRREIKWAFSWSRLPLYKGHDCMNFSCL